MEIEVENKQDLEKDHYSDYYRQRYVQLSQVMRKMVYKIITKDLSDECTLREAGQALLESGLEDYSTGGLFLYSITSGAEWFSPKFRKTLGFGDEEDFPNATHSWRTMISPDDLKRALYTFGKHIVSRGKEPYLIKCSFTTKQGQSVDLICDADVVTWEPYIILFGTHSKLL